MTIKKKWIFFIFLLFLGILLWKPFLKSLAHALVYETNLARADAIVVLGGGSGSRVKKAVELYHEELAPKLIFTGNQFLLTSQADLMKDYAKKLGVRSKYIILEKNSESTIDHVRNLKHIFEEHNIERIIVVTSLFHTRRSYMVFKQLSEFDIDVMVVGSSDGIDYDNWWHHHEMIEKVLIEFQKLFWYFLFV